jgi:hypothetical protein
MTSDDDKAKIGERITGEHDPKDPDGLLTLDDVAADVAPGPEVASDEYPEIPGRHKMTPHQLGNEPV